jgi:hypothetical protein
MPYVPQRHDVGVAVTLLGMPLPTAASMTALQTAQNIAPPSAPTPAALAAC